MFGEISFVGDLLQHGIQGDSPNRDVTIPAESDAPVPKKKAKKTGKPKPVHETINFRLYFERWLSENGVTYRTWVSEHRRREVWVCLGLDLYLVVFCVFLPTLCSSPVLSPDVEYLTLS